MLANFSMVGLCSCVTLLPCGAWSAVIKGVGGHCVTVLVYVFNVSIICFVI